MHSQSDLSAGPNLMSDARSCRDERLAFDRPDRAKSDESRDPGRILVVDDDPMLRQMVVNYLNENTCAPSRPLGVRRWRVTLPKVSRIW